MARAAQLKLFQGTMEHGGDFAKGKRKGRRPFSAKKPMHVVLRRKDSFHGINFLLYAKVIRVLLQVLSQRWAVRVYEHSINTNHLHLVIRARHKADFQNFLRHFSGVLSMKLTRAKKGKPLLSRLFEVVYTRVAEWGRAFTRLITYVRQNQLEATGSIAYRPRRH